MTPSAPTEADPGRSAPDIDGLAADLLPPRYQPRQEVARGGMGLVVLVHDGVLGRPLALKTLQPRFAGRADLSRRFLDEARITGQLQHPGIPPVHDLGQLADGRPFFTMKLVKGRTLDALLAAGEGDPLEPFERVCLTVAYAHSHGVIHRDLKPSNIMVGAFGEVQVMDWGLAKPTGEPPAAEEPAGATVIQTSRDADSDEGTEAGSMLGTPAYMPPEQAKGEAVDARADVFALGAILCELLTGQPPYVGTRAEVRAMAQLGLVGPALQRLAGCSADVELIRLASACLAPDKQDRPADAAAVAGAVRAYREGLDERLRRAERERAAADARAGEERKRWRVTLALSASITALIVLAAGGGLYLQSQREARRLDQVRREAETRAAAEAVLAKSDGLMKQQRWAEARAVLEPAGGTIPAELSRRFEEALADVTLAAEIDDLKFRKAVLVRDEYDYAGADAAYLAAFQRRGLWRAGSDPTATADRVRASPLKAVLIPALDDWALVALEDDRRAFILRVAWLADDPHPWLLRFRDPANWNDRARRARLAADADPADLSPGVATALCWNLDLVQAIHLLRRVQRHHPTDFWINYSLGVSLVDAEHPDGVGYLRAAVTARPTVAIAHHYLGTALERTGKRAEAAGCYREAIRLAPGSAASHLALGQCLQASGDRAAALTPLRRAVELAPRDVEAWFVLGHTALADGGYAEARDGLRAFLSLASKADERRREAAAELKAVERYIVLAPLLPAILKGGDPPADARDCLDLAVMCRVHRRLHAAAVRLYAAALAARPALGNEDYNRLYAACSALLAAQDEGLDAAARGRLRDRALRWLREDLAGWRRIAAREDAALREQAAEGMAWWRSNPELADFHWRGLPEDERAAWHNFWEQVKALERSVRR